MGKPRKDKDGYLRGNLEHSDLIHRQIAYSEIYLKKRHKYSKRFSEYVVHHINTNKDKFNVNNLYICTKEEHNQIHQEQKRRLKKFKNSYEIDNFLANLKRKKHIPKTTNTNTWKPPIYTGGDVSKPMKQPSMPKGIKFIIIIAILLLGWFYFSNLEDSKNPNNIPQVIVDECKNSCEENGVIYDRIEMGDDSNKVNCFCITNNNLYDNFYKITCGMKIEDMMKIFGEYNREFAWEDNEMKIPSGFIYETEKYKLSISGQSFKQINRIAITDARLTDKETNELIKKMPECIPNSFL
tara:strand:- start:1959 stop:2846 length:888 start_codon:yes stop_codon:yes gene_type:complete